LLSGTPALNRPAELFAQVDMLQPGLLGTWSAFTKEHCKPTKTRWGMEYKGATNLPALFSKLQPVMIRRKKTDVLKQLPEKRRQYVPMEMNGSVLAPVAALREQLKELKRDSPAFGKLWSECLQQTGISKVPLVLDYLNDLLEGGSKVLLFAHHIKVLDAIEQELFRQKVGHIRIDGSVSPSDRQLRCSEFQSKECVRVALLGLLAAGQGITLTAADTVLFAEMSVTPGVMLQSEDRAHRIGQRSSVNIHYLVAKGTIDEEVWRMIGNKLSVVGRVLDGKTARLGAQPSATLSRAEVLPDNLPAVSDGVTSKAAVFSIFDRKHNETQHQWSCPTCTLRNVGRKICAACGSSCPASAASCKAVSVDGEPREPSTDTAFSFSGSFAVSKNTQRVYVFSDPLGASLIGTITQSQLDNDEMSNSFSSHTGLARIVSCFVSDFFSLRAIQQRQLSDCIITLPLSARVNGLADAERCRSSSTIRHSATLPFDHNRDAACGMCGKAFAALCPVSGRFCSGACKDE
jgi:ferredoxin